MKRHITEFDSADGYLYRLEIEVPEGSGTQGHVAGESPFVTQQEGGDTIYEPVKAEGATAQIITEGIPTDIFAARPLDRPATLYRVTTNSTAWVGYVEPCVYSQGWGKVETMEINLVNTLAALKTVPFSLTGLGRRSMTMAEAVLGILRLDPRLKSLYMSTCVQTQSSGSADVLSSLKVSGENFFRKRESPEQTDDDLSWSCYDVLQEICRWLGLTMIQRAEAVYMIDYDAVGADLSEYIRYDVNTGATLRLDLFSHGHVDGTVYYDSHANFSLAEVYDRVTVKDDFYTFDSVMGALFDGAQNITCEEAKGYRSITRFGVTVGDDYQLEGGSNKKMNVFFTAREFGKYVGVAVKYFRPADWVDPAIYVSTSLGNAELMDAAVKDKCSYIDATLRGCYLMKVFTAAMPDDFNYDDVYRIVTESESDDRVNIDKVVDEFMKAAGVSSLSLTNYVMLLNPPEPYHIGRDMARRYPFLRLKPGSLDFGGENNYIVIKGSVAFQPYYSRGLEDKTTDGPRFPIPNSSKLMDSWFDDMGHKNDALDKDDNHAYLACSLRFGSRYWNGKEWVAGSDQAHPTFNVGYFDVDSTDKEDRRGPQIVGREHKILNTVNWRQGLSEEGYCIPVPFAMSGELELEVYAPIDNEWKSTLSGSFKGTRWNSDIMLLKDFDMVFAIGDPSLSGDLDTDTQYSNVIDGMNAGSLEDISFKVCTSDGKKPNHSSVMLLSGGYADKMFHRALAEAERGSTGWDGADSSEGLRQEEHLVFRLCHQYSSPTSVLQCNLRRGTVLPWGRYTDETLAGKYFIADTISTDWRLGFDTVKLVEKK